MSVRGFVSTAAGTVLLAGTLTAAAAEMQADARVVDVVPLSQGAAAGDCHPPKPPSGGLAELLAWDLRLDCAATPATAYRVYYRWDGRTYSRVMTQRPGATVPVRVRLH